MGPSKALTLTAGFEFPARDHLTGTGLAGKLWTVPARFDQNSFRLDAVERTTSGAVRVPAVLTRAGVFSYRTPEGQTINEWRPLEEVNRADSLATLEDAPVVADKHPRRGVREDSYRELTVGHVRSQSIRQDAETSGIGAQLVIGDGPTIARIEKRQLHDISAGYDVRIDEASGVVPNGQPDAGKKYDRIQRDIRYNHVALLPRGDGRQGQNVSLRLDAAGEQLSDQEPPKMKTTVRCDGKDHVVEAGSEEHLKLQARADAERDHALAEATAATVREIARADAAEAELEAIKTERKAQVRNALEAEAKGVLGAEAKFDAADTDRQIREKVLAKVHPGVSYVGRADAYVEASYDLALASEARTPANSGLDMARRANDTSARTDRADADTDAETPAARAARLDSVANNLWKGKPAK